MKFQEASMLLIHQENLNFAFIDFENYAFGEIYILENMEKLHKNGFQIIVFRRRNARDRRNLPDDVPYEAENLAQWMIQSMAIGEGPDEITELT